MSACAKPWDGARGCARTAQPSYPSAPPNGPRAPRRASGRASAQSGPPGVSRYDPDHVFRGLLKEPLEGLLLSYRVDVEGELVEVVGQRFLSRGDDDPDGGDWLGAWPYFAEHEKARKALPASTPLGR